MLKTNKIHHGDCLDLMKQIPDKSIDLILTDPPYGIGYLSPMTKNHKKIENDFFDDWKKLLNPMFIQFKRIISDTGCVVCSMGGGGKTPVSPIFTLEGMNYFNLIQTLVWHKFIGIGWRYRPAYENIIIFSKSKDNYNFYDKTNKCSNVILGINQLLPNKDEHPTQKPVKLMRKLIEIHSKPNDLILDPFIGSGTTAIAALQTKRNFIGIEKEEDYVKIANQRIKDYLEEKRSMLFTERKD